jgi:hypothetical protein
MREAFIAYLRTVGLNSDAALKRAREAFDRCSLMCPEEIEDIFVEEYIKDDGTREIESLECFSGSYWISSAAFLTQEGSALVYIKKNIKAYRVEVADYAMKKASEKSRLRVDILVLGSAIEESGSLKASKENCEHLWRIVEKHVKANLLG